jgi:hypothetical protein
MNEKEKKALTWARRGCYTIENNARKPMNTPSPNGDEKFTIFCTRDATSWNMSVSYKIWGIEDRNENIHYTL